MNKIYTLGLMFFFPLLFILDACKTAPSASRGGRAGPFQYYTIRTGQVAEAYKKKMGGESLNIAKIYAQKNQISRTFEDAWAGFNEAGGTAEAAYSSTLDPRFQGHKIGIMLAGNSGLPGGAIAHSSRHDFKKYRDNTPGSAIHAGYRTQEEDMVANWLFTEKKVLGKDYSSTFNRIDRKWGLEDLSQGATSKDTLQGVNYVDTRDPKDFGDVWVVRKALLSNKVNTANPGSAPLYTYETDKTFQADLFFVGAPNANSDRGPTSTTGRTRNALAHEQSKEVGDLGVYWFPTAQLFHQKLFQHATNDEVNSYGILGNPGVLAALIPKPAVIGNRTSQYVYTFHNQATGRNELAIHQFEKAGAKAHGDYKVMDGNGNQHKVAEFMIEGIKNIVRSTLDAMASEGVEIAYIALAGTGIYAGFVPDQATVDGRQMCTRFHWKGQDQANPQDKWNAYIHRKFLKTYFDEFVKEVAEEDVLPGKPRYSFFKKIALVDVAF